MPRLRGLELCVAWPCAAAEASRAAAPQAQSYGMPQPADAQHAAVSVPTFDVVYAETFRSVWRLVRRMGVVDTSVDDVVQEVFVVVYRKLSQFTGASTVKTWVLAIATGVVRNYRRTLRRKGPGFALATVVEDPELLEGSLLDPYQQLSRIEAGKLVQQVLDRMDDDKASLFILVEIEGLTVAEVARTLDLNVQTAYSRLSAARREFERGVRQFRARELG